MSAPSAPTPSLRRGFAVVDVETSGLDPTKHRVIEVAVTQLSPAGVVESEWSTLVRARGGTGPVHIHGLTDHDLRDAPTFAEVAGTLRGSGPAWNQGWFMICTSVGRSDGRCERICRMSAWASGEMLASGGISYSLRRMRS